MSWWSDEKWTYKNYVCRIEYDVEEDNVKAFHYVDLPNGGYAFLDISPYNTKKETMEKMVDNYIATGKWS